MRVHLAVLLIGFSVFDSEAAQKLFNPSELIFSQISETTDQDFGQTFGFVEPVVKETRFDRMNA